MRRFVFLVLTFAAVPLFAMPARNGSGPIDRGPRERHVILTPAQPLTEADREELAAQGVRVQAPLTGGRYVAKVAPAAAPVDGRIVAMAPMTLEDKIHRSALREFASGRPVAELDVLFHSDVPFEEARQAIVEAGGALADSLTTRFLPGQRLRARFTPADAREFATDDRVFGIAGALRLRIQSDNSKSAEFAHVTELLAAPYGLSGQGVTVSVFEIGEAQSTHVEFSGRATTHGPGFCAPSDSSCPGDQRHATHVMGTIGSAGSNRADSKGMAPAVTLHEFPVSEDWLDLKNEQLKGLGVVADNNSWGYVLGWNGGGTTWWGYGEYQGAYELPTTSAIDEISRANNILFVHSAGNAAGRPTISGEWYEHSHMDENQENKLSGSFCYSKDLTGNDCPAQCSGTESVSNTPRCETTKHPEGPWTTVGLTASAKNILAVGNMTSSGTISGSSSRGPARDGRVKPDVVALGSFILSTVPTNAYQTLSGTSMAAPAVTGVAALLTQQWRQTFGADPLPSQLRALILAGATDLGAAGPDYTFGFGLVNAKSSVDTILADAGQGTRIRTASVGHGQQQEFTAQVSETGKLRLLLNWADPYIKFLGGDDIAAKALVNNLDLRVVDPLGQTQYPYVLNKDAVDTPATRGLNTVDNAEMLEIAAATPGTYKVIVSGTTVPEGPQQFVLVSSAALAPAPPPCSDVQEGNDSAATAWGNVPSGARVNAALCTQADLDFFKFTATKKGTVAVSVETGDTPVRVTLTGTSINVTKDVAANTKVNLSANAATVPNALTLKFEPTATVGAAPQYNFVATYGQTTRKKNRGVRH